MDWETDRVVEGLLERRLVSGNRSVRGVRKPRRWSGRSGISLRTRQPGKRLLSRA